MYSPLKLLSVFFDEINGVYILTIGSLSYRHEYFRRNPIIPRITSLKTYGVKSPFCSLTMPNYELYTGSYSHPTNTQQPKSNATYSFAFKHPHKSHHTRIRGHAGKKDGISCLKCF